MAASNEAEMLHKRRSSSPVRIHPPNFIPQRKMSYWVEKGKGGSTKGELRWNQRSRGGPLIVDHWPMPMRVDSK
ncbi:hypothetical protein Tcan_14477 [Toxocara canis]|uniref:Uncharacterized protein n=1 Tax=Toxocara canis TaxID=6265 RepID=A0A0B2VCC4_TOXCA|nr:hypothetical protein Tcan_14477 [Toxocara canis]